MNKNGRSGRLRGLAYLAVIAAAVGAACSRSQLGWPRVPVSAESPDHRYTALVRNHPNIDPPAQSIAIRDAAGRETYLRDLGGDVEWCDQIAWSADSRRVAFIIMGAKLEVYEAESHRRVGTAWLGKTSGEYPPAFVVRDFSLSADGRLATFRTCARRDDPKKRLAKDVWDNTTAPCSETQAVALTPSATR